MRIYTEKDKLALAAALRSFWGFMAGDSVRTSKCLAYAEKALAAGITADELLNRDNYYRVAEVSALPDIDTYVDALINRSAIIRSLKDEDGWADPAGFILYAAIFHDFYQKINATGGTFTTSNAKVNLQKAISRNSLQAILSEKLIHEVEEKTGKGESLTCYAYIEALLRDAELYDIDNGLTEEQEAFRALLEHQADAAGDETAEEKDPVPEKEEGELMPEGRDTDNDESIFSMMSMEEEDDFTPDGRPSETNAAFIAAYNPKQYKRNCVAEAVLTLTVGEIMEFSKTIPSAHGEQVCDLTLEDFISALAEGRFDKGAESIEGANIHQRLITELYTHYMECIAMQGVEIGEEAASRMDILYDSWDMRDANTRKVQKIKELIYQNAMDDTDLLDVIGDLEKYYQEQS